MTQKVKAAVFIAAEMLTIGEVAALLGCSPRTASRLADSGRMPSPVKLGSLKRFSRTRILQWVADGCPPCRSAKGGKR